VCPDTVRFESSACTQDELLSLQSVYRAIIISKLMYGSSVRWGFASPTEWQQTQAFIHRSERRRFTTPDPPSFADLCCEANDNSILNNSHHVLRHLLHSPSQASQHYSLRSRRHNLQLSIRPTDRNFLHRMHHSDSYWHSYRHQTVTVILFPISYLSATDDSLPPTKYHSFYWCPFIHVRHCTMYRLQHCLEWVMRE